MPTPEQEEYWQWSTRYMADKWCLRGLPSKVWGHIIHYADSLCESPIEKRMLAGLVFCSFRDQYEDLNVIIPEADATEKMVASHYHSAIIIPQATLRKINWRVDFLVVLCQGAQDSSPPMMIIECDGHDFHERTKAQAARDRKRDRDAQRLGLPVLRFTGSEIVRNLDSCVDQIGDFGADFMDRPNAQRSHG